jgi:hypothetical protein
MVESVRSTKLVEALGLGPAHIARRGTAGRIGVLVMPNQRLPVFVSRPLHGLPELVPGVGQCQLAAWKALIPEPSLSPAMMLLSRASPGVSQMPLPARS